MTESRKHGASATDARPPTQASLAPIFLIVLVDVLGLTIVFPLLPLYAESFGASAFVAALLVPAYAVCQMLASPVLGKLSDRYGRRRVLLLSQAGTCLGFLLIAAAPALVFVFLGRILDGLTAGNLSVAQAYIADNTRPSDRARSFALIGIAFGLGFMLGPAAAAHLSRYGMSVPLYAAAGLSLTSILCTLVLLEPDTPEIADSPHARAELARAGSDPLPADETPLLPGGRRLGLFELSAYGSYFRQPLLGLLLIEFFLYLFAFSMFMGGFALFAERRYSWHGKLFTPHEIGWLYALGGFVGVIVQGGLLGRLVKRFGERALISTGLVALGVGYAALAHVEPLLPLIFATMVAAFGNALLRPSLTSLITRAVSRAEHGVVLGLTQTLASLATILGAPLSGWLIDRGHLVSWSALAGAVPVLALVLGFFGSKFERHAAASAG